MATPPLAERPHWRPEDIFPAAEVGSHCFLHRDIEIGLHTHDFIEVNVVVQGRGRHFVDGRWQGAAAGQVFVFPPGAGHAYENRGRLHVYNLLFQRPFWARSLPGLADLPGCLGLLSSGAPGRSRVFSLPTAECDRVLALCAQAALESRARASAPTEWLGLTIASLLGRAWAARAGGVAAGEETPVPPGLLATIEHVARHPGDKHTLVGLAARAGVGPRQLDRLFRRVTGASPMAFVTQVRVRLARERLADPTRTITDVALEAGFYDAAHFTRTFRAVTGATPAAYRRARVAG